MMQFEGMKTLKLAINWPKLEINVKKVYLSFTGNLITMLRLLKNTIFLSTVHRASDIIKNVRPVSETLDTRLLDGLCDVNTDGKHDVRQKYLKWL